MPNAFGASNTGDGLLKMGMNRIWEVIVGPADDEANIGRGLFHELGAAFKFQASSFNDLGNLIKASHDIQTNNMAHLDAAIRQWRDILVKQLNDRDASAKQVTDTQTKQLGDLGTSLKDARVEQVQKLDDLELSVKALLATQTETLNQLTDIVKQLQNSTKENTDAIRSLQEQLPTIIAAKVAEAIGDIFQQKFTPTQPDETSRQAEEGQSRAVEQAGGSAFQNGQRTPETRTAQDRSDRAGVYDSHSGDNGRSAKRPRLVAAWEKASVVLVECQFLGDEKSQVNLEILLPVTECKTLHKLDVRVSDGIIPRLWTEHLSPCFKDNPSLSPELCDRISRLVLSDPDTRGDNSKIEIEFCNGKTERIYHQWYERYIETGRAEEVKIVFQCRLMLKDPEASLVGTISGIENVEGKMYFLKQER
jgi:hypothetical protein